jgi:hypothetical protein
MSKKQPNRLAKLIDHQSFAGSALPRSLSTNMQLYTQATTEIKSILADCLPDEILNSCWVVDLTQEQLTLSVASMTAANHIRYLQKAYLRVLSEQSITFQQLKHIRVVVAQNSSTTPLLNTQLAGLVKSHEVNGNRALSQDTKRTIAQAAEHVTTDKNLKKALLRLLND